MGGHGYGIRLTVISSPRAQQKCPDIDAKGNYGRGKCHKSYPNPKHRRLLPREGRTLFQRSRQHLETLQRQPVLKKPLSRSECDISLYHMSA
ncbi:hypothetical protein RIB2604_03500380 [Aspergillus luchuensis]|uniref:Uncharacterized protein n=1 Tax=Aspergillus kawachii TaxID=1069201 RepID=A0A146G007_ASPKA|nr:hypothetical protein RIB2604_03500380 [Aspergillus luchuensis]